MFKTLGGIKHHWRPVYNLRASHSTMSTSFQTVLDLTATKRGRLAVRSGSYLNYESRLCEVEVTVDGRTFIFRYKAGINVFRGDFDFSNACRVRHRVDTEITGGTRTDISYWVI